MWPKAFAQLVELAPHISRLLPMADRFFQSKSASEDATRKAIDAMSQEVRADLNQITVAQAGLSDQITDLGRKFSRFESDGTAAKLSADSLERRLTAIEARQGRLLLLLATALILLAAICILEAMILAHGR
jgi:hypothetical protein